METTAAAILLEPLDAGGLTASLDDPASRTTPSTPVARGEAEIGFQQISELLEVSGVDFVGPLPAEVQRVTVFTAGVAVGAGNPNAARALIEFFLSPIGLATMAKSGLDPIARH